MRVNQVAAEFRKVSNKQMAETTKRTIRENVAINAQLTKMSDKTLEMIAVRTQWEGYLITNFIIWGELISILSIHHNNM